MPDRRTILSWDENKDCQTKGDNSQSQNLIHMDPNFRAACCNLGQKSAGSLWVRQSCRGKVGSRLFSNWKSRSTGRQSNCAADNYIFSNPLQSLLLRVSIFLNWIEMSEIENQGQPGSEIALLTISFFKHIQIFHGLNFCRWQFRIFRIELKLSEIENQGRGQIALLTHNLEKEKSGEDWKGLKSRFQLKRGWAAFFSQKNTGLIFSSQKYFYRHNTGDLVWEWA